VSEKIGTWYWHPGLRKVVQKNAKAPPLVTSLPGSHKPKTKNIF